ncbi:MAG: preprotein translocase subunit SecG [Alphaproteobacteria bacterium]|nr:preprotein translocase subunit SecG [Alphaproteobacteria bacterium]
MHTVLVVIHLMLAIGLVGVVLLQRSEGGGLGMGSGGMGGFLSGRGQATLLSRITAGLAATFMVTSIALTMVSGTGSAPRSIVEGVDQSAPAATETTTEGEEAPSVPLAE